MNPELHRVLCCPICHGNLLDKLKYLQCSTCSKEFPLMDGIPDMRVYESPAHSSEFNKHQAVYESELHDEEAESNYEKAVIEVYGVKTRLMVENWACEIDKTHTQTVLDYGCGTGQVSRVMAHHVQPLFAFDISEKSLRRNIRDNGVLGVLANSLYLPFKNGVFDIVCINGVLHHIVDLERAICELARISAGSVFVSEGIPRGRPSLRRTRNYPGLGRKAAYVCYVLRFITGTVTGKIRRLGAATLRLRWHNTPKTFSGSKYERPLDVHSVESLMAANGFDRNRLRYYTNIDTMGDGVIKKMWTRMLVNNIFGTHFDLRMDKDSSTSHKI